MYRVPQLDYVRANNLLVTTGQRLNPQKLRQHLELSGYQSVTQVVEQGEFAVCGSLLNIKFAAFFEQIHSLFDYLQTNSVIMTLEGVLETASQFWRDITDR
jgi:transcription-repair coupling factor (superfamily II helicase)